MIIAPSPNIPDAAGSGTLDAGEIENVPPAWTPPTSGAMPMRIWVLAALTGPKRNCPVGFGGLLKGVPNQLRVLEPQPVPERNANAKAAVAVEPGQFNESVFGSFADAVRSKTPPFQSTVNDENVCDVES